MRSTAASVPGRVGDQVMHRLVASPHVPGVDPRGHGLDALPVSRQTQAGEVGAQRLAPIRMSEGTRQPVEVLTEPPFAGIARVGSHAPILAWYPRRALTFVTQ